MRIIALIPVTIDLYYGVKVHSIQRLFDSAEEKNKYIVNELEAESPVTFIIYSILLFILLFIIYYLLFIIYYLLFIIYYLLFIYISLSVNLLIRLLLLLFFLKQVIFLLFKTRK